MTLKRALYALGLTAFFAVGCSTEVGDRSFSGCSPTASNDTDVNVGVPTPTPTPEPTPSPTPCQALPDGAPCINSFECCSRSCVSGACR